MTQELQTTTSWKGAAERGLQAHAERQQIIRKLLVEDEDFGKIPGTDKPTLYKAGAEKVIDALNLYPDYVPLVVVEDWDKPLFHYRYRCLLRHRGTDAIVATGVGSCNSRESRYRWRDAKLKCPHCGQEAVIKGKDDFGGGWLCFWKRGGCGAKWPDGAREIEGQNRGRVENDDIESVVNTIDKMAQKRASVAATLNLGLSGVFTQDLEDMPEEATAKPAAKSAKPAGKQKKAAVPKQKDASYLLGRMAEMSPAELTELNEWLDREYESNQKRFTPEQWKILSGAMQARLAEVEGDVVSPE